MAVCFTAVTGYIVFTGNFDIQIINLILGVFILAGGASALNEFQERKYDAKMQRTQHRPLPSGKITSQNALLISILLIISGLLILYFSFFLLFFFSLFPIILVVILAGG
jgi:protoheme IX farnesyltransferase